VKMSYYYYATFQFLKKICRFTKNYISNFII